MASRTNASAMIGRYKAKACGLKKLSRQFEPYWAPGYDVECVWGLKPNRPDHILTSPISNDFETETSRPKASKHMGDGKQEGMQPITRGCFKEAPMPPMPTDANTWWSPWADENQACKIPDVSAA